MMNVPAGSSSLHWLEVRLAMLGCRNLVDGRGSWPRRRLLGGSSLTGQRIYPAFLLINYNKKFKTKLARLHLSNAHIIPACPDQLISPAAIEGSLVRGDMEVLGYGNCF